MVHDSSFTRECSAQQYPATLLKFTCENGGHAWCLYCTAIRWLANLIPQTAPQSATGLWATKPSNAAGWCTTVTICTNKQITPAEPVKTGCNTHNGSIYLGRNISRTLYKEYCTNSHCTATAQPLWHKHVQWQ